MRPARARWPWGRTARRRHAGRRRMWQRRRPGRVTTLSQRGPARTHRERKASAFVPLSAFWGGGGRKGRGGGEAKQGAVHTRGDAAKRALVPGWQCAERSTHAGPQSWARQHMHNGLRPHLLLVFTSTCTID
eukprot:354169-Chlamydomonas_euryale.AAC.1